MSNIHNHLSIQVEVFWAVSPCSVAVSYYRPRLETSKLATFHSTLFNLS